MNPDTGEIRVFRSEEDAKKAGFTVPLSKKQHKKLKPMTRNQRKAWSKKLRKKK